MVGFNASFVLCPSNNLLILLVTPLAKGERFLVVSKALPVEDITVNIEAGIRNLLQATPDEISCESASEIQLHNYLIQLSQSCQVF